MNPCISRCLRVHTLRQRQDGRHFPDNVFKCIFLNENAWISIKISLKFVPKCPINNISALVQIMAWLRPGDKPLYEPMMVRLPTHICVTRPQWVKDLLQYILDSVYLGCDDKHIECPTSKKMYHGISGTIQCMCTANERWHYTVTPYLIGWVHTQNNPCIHITYGK